MKRLPTVLDGSGTNPRPVFTECGSFYNAGDNRIVRSVLKEDICSGTVTSLSFSSGTWLCSSCPIRHPILSKSGGGPLAAGQHRLCLPGKRSPLPTELVRRQVQPQLRSPWRLQRLQLLGSPRRTRQTEPQPRKARRAALLLVGAATVARCADYRMRRIFTAENIESRTS
jgi:hypothetical protein